MIDGFLIKPDSYEITKSIINISKRLQYHEEIFIYFSNGVKYDFVTKGFYKDHKEITLGEKENMLFHLLLEKKGQPVSKNEIASKVWYDKCMTESALKNLIASLRSKLGKDAVLNKNGFGWSLNGSH